jgi:hypothetical protein
VDKSKQLLVAQKFHPRRYSPKLVIVFLLLSSRRHRVPPPRRRNSSQPLHLSPIGHTRISTSLSRTSLTRSRCLSSSESATGWILAAAARHGHRAPPHHGQLVPLHLPPSQRLFWLRLDSVVLIGSSYLSRPCRAHQNDATFSGSRHRNRPRRRQP